MIFYIAFTIGTLIDFEMKKTIIVNVYLTAIVDGEMRKMLGSDFGKDARWASAIVHLIHDLKRALSNLMSHVSNCMHNKGYEASYVDFDLFLEPIIGH